MSPNSGSSGQAIGKITAATGRVIAIKPDGTERVLEVGATVQRNERIVTNNDSSVEIYFFNNNQSVSLGGQQQLYLGDNLFSSAEGDEETAEERSIEEVQAEIADGADPLAVTTASSAGDDKAKTDEGRNEAPTVERNSLDMPVIEREEVTEKENRSQTEANVIQANDANDRFLSTALEFEEESDDPVVTPYQAPAENVSATGVENDNMLSGRVGSGSDGQKYALMSSPEAGTVTLTEDGFYEFIPGSDFEYLAEGETRTVSFVFEARDFYGNRSQASVNINIQGVNNAPDVEKPITLEATQDQSVISLDLLEHAIDKDASDVLSVTNLRLVTGNETGISISADGRRLEIDPDDYRFLREGESETITYEYLVTDPQGESVPQSATITLSGRNDLPVIEQAVNVSLDQNFALEEVDLLEGSTDIDANDEINVVRLQLTAGDPVGITESDDGNSLSVDASAYDTLAEGESETLEYTYEVDDGHGETVSQTASITIEGQNDAPEAIDLSNDRIDENDSGAVVGNLTTTDVDTSDTHSYVVDDDRFEVVDNQLKLKSGISLDHETEDTVTVSVTSTDNHGEDVTQSFTVNITDINETPESSSSSVIIDEDSLYRFSLTDFPFSDPDEGDSLETVFIDSLPGKGEIELNGTAIEAGDEISRSDIEAGNLTFLPEAHESGEGYASFEFRVNGGGLSSAVQTVSFDVTPVVDESNLTLNSGNSITSDEDVSISLALDHSLQDRDGSETNALLLSGLPVGSVLTDGSNTITSDGSDVDISNWQHDQLRMTPPENSHTDFTLTFTSTTTETETGEEAVVTQTLTVDLTAVDDAPVTGDIDLGQTDEDTAFTITEETLLAEASDVDGDALSVTRVMIADASMGSVSNNDDGTWTYTPAANYHGDDVAFEFVVSDGTTGDEATARAVIDVLSINDVPTVDNALDEPFTEDTGSQSINLLTGASDADEDALTVDALSLSSGDDSGVTVSGSTLDVDTTAYQYLGEGDTETLNYTYNIIDGNGGVVSQTLSITLTGTNDAAVISGVDTGSVTEDNAESLTTSGALTLSDADADEASFQENSLTGDYGQLTIDTTGNWSYSANNNQDTIQNLGASETLEDYIHDTGPGWHRAYDKHHHSGNQ